MTSLAERNETQVPKPSQRPMISAIDHKKADLAAKTGKRTKELEKYKYCLMFAPLYYKQIIKANLDYLRSGGQFILIRPDVEIVSLKDLASYL